MKRRQFLKSFTASVGAWPLLQSPQAASVADRLSSLTADLQDSFDDRAYWARVGKEFLLDPSLVHFNCASIGACPSIVIDALTAMTREIEQDPYGHLWGDGLADGLEAVRESAAAFLNARASEIALTRNATEGISAVAGGLDLRAGDEVLTTNHEHPGGMVAWQHLARHRGVKVVCLQLPKHVVDSAEILQRVEDHLSPRTRVCSFCHVDTITGLRMPIAEIAKVTRPKDIFFMCDGAQAPGMLHVDLAGLGVDAYASSSHKWMLAPKGSGLLYVRAGVQARVNPVLLASGYGVYSASSGTRDVAQIIAHGVVMDFHRAIGQPRVEARCKQLSGRLSEALSKIDGLTPLSPRADDLASGIVSFAIDRAKGTSADVREGLWAEHRIRVKTAQGTYALMPDAQRQDYNALRLSTHVFNNEDQIDRVAKAIKATVG